MSEVVVTKDEIITYEKLKLISELAPIRERIAEFERKYGMSFEEFEKRLEREEESFEAWDDYIEWKAYARKLKELQKKLKEIESAQRVRVA
jgi:phosphatidylserine/phosphatidylglycerophosphate/cardiolipin synthase-like enzyme